MKSASDYFARIANDANSQLNGTILLHTKPSQENTMEAQIFPVKHLGWIDSVPSALIPES